VHKSLSINCFEEKKSEAAVEAAEAAKVREAPKMELIRFQTDTE
jgi:hypothetical protein